MTLNSKTDCISSLNACLSRTADWRRGLQAKFPGDARNGKAAAKLELMASQAYDLSDDAWAELQPHFNWCSGTWSDSVSQVSRLVEFRNVNSFATFVKVLARILSEKAEIAA